MRLFEFVDRLGKKTPSVDEVAKKHGVDMSVIEQQLVLGIEVEKEHVDDPGLAMEIALDHLDELPDYYTRLKRMEKK